MTREERRDIALADYCDLLKKNVKDARRHMFQAFCDGFVLESEIPAGVSIDFEYAARRTQNPDVMRVLAPKSRDYRKAIVYNRWCPPGLRREIVMADQILAGVYLPSTTDRELFEAILERWPKRRWMLASHPLATTEILGEIAMGHHNPKKREIALKRLEESGVLNLLGV